MPDHPKQPSREESPDPERHHGGDRRTKLPEPPDIRRVERLRQRVRSDRAAGQGERRGVQGGFGPAAGKRIRDVGFYTLIPTVMAAGPLVGYFLGRLVENKIGCEPWPMVLGVLLGMVAGFRQVYLMLARRPNGPDESG